MAILVLEIKFFSADNGVKLGQIVWNYPVQSDVGERRLRAPSGRSVYTVNEALDALLDLFVGEVVNLDERRKIGVEGAERLRACPFVLHDAEEVDHLIAESAEVAGRRAGDFARHAAQTFHNKLFQGPTGTITREHAEVVDMDIRVAMSLFDFFVVDFGKPVVGGDRAAVGKDKSADGIGNGGVLLHTPVVDFKIVADRGLVVKHGGGHVAHFFVILTIQNVRFRNVHVAGLNEHHFDAVLHVFDGNHSVRHFVGNRRGNLQT